MSICKKYIINLLIWIASYYEKKIFEVKSKRIRYKEWQYAQFFPKNDKNLNDKFAIFKEKKYKYSPIN